MTKIAMKNRVNELDLLRFIGALMVVFYHYAFRGYYADNMTTMPYPLLDGPSMYGYLGVTLFFMISGFVIMMTMKGASFLRFVISRSVRLYPAFWVCCSITFIVSLLLGGDRYAVNLKQYLVNMTLLSGFVKIPSIDGAYWSLFIEMRFYALAGLLLLLNKEKLSERCAMVWLFISYFDFLCPVRFFEVAFITKFSAAFISGIFFYFVMQNGMTKIRAFFIVMSYGLCICNELAAIPEFNMHYNVALNPLAVIVMLSIFHVVFLLVSLRKTGFLSKIQWLALGAMTYPLYLVHQHLGYILFSRLHTYINPHLVFWGCISFALVLSYLISKYIECPVSFYLKAALQRVLPNQGSRSLDAQVNLCRGDSNS